MPSPALPIAPIPGTPRKRWTLAPPLCNPPIHHKHLPKLPHHHIVWLQIPVQNPAGMGVRHPFTHLKKNPKQPPLVELPAHGIVPCPQSPDHLLQRPASNQFHAVVRPPIRIPPQGMHGHNARVIQQRKNPRLSFKPPVSLHTQRADLQRHFPSQHRILALQHTPHSAPSNLCPPPIPSDARTELPLPIQPNRRICGGKNDRLIGICSSSTARPRQLAPVLELWLRRQRGRRLLEGLCSIWVEIVSH